MLVSDVMHRMTHVCRMNDDLQHAVHLMECAHWQPLPVVDNAGRVVTLLTARDVVSTVAAMRRALWDIGVNEAEATSAVVTCHGDDDGHDALRTMCEHRVANLIVVSSTGAAIGVLSLKDVLHHTAIGGASGPEQFGPGEALVVWKQVCDDCG